MTYFKAKEEHWSYQEHWAAEDGDAACLLELRARVERLELGAGIYKAVLNALKPSSLKEQALEALETLQQRTTDPNIVEPLRRALEQLDD